MPESPSMTSGSLEALVGRVADEFLRRQQKGESPDPEEYAARHPEAAELIRGVLRSLRLIEESAGGAGAGGEPVAGMLGDFRILREVGRGGMGVVYEAEQISLGRRVALKVLPFAATMDPRQLQRFQNEARAAASLHHEHIVPVYAVGCERGVHFYAMQFIEGLTLAQVISRQDAAGEPTAPHAAGADDTTPRPAATETPRDAAFFRRAAEWGAQAAEALEHAHSLGVVHRDVKPGNLMIDAQGKLWVTDFGLARTGAEGNLTVSGDVLGTLRYTSPEQALAKHGLVDHRTDVYALGATLYELITGRPAVEGSDRAEILWRIASEEPVPPRKHERAVPLDLQTIVLEALSKEPSGRYGSAAEMAADLRCFLELRPILAKPPGVTARIRKWALRHRGLVAAAMAGLVLSVAALGIALILVADANSRTRLALEEQKRLRGEADQHAITARQEKKKAEDEREIARREYRRSLQAVIRSLAVLATLKNAIKEARSRGDNQKAEALTRQAGDLVQAAADAIPEDVKDFSGEARYELVCAMDVTEVIDEVGLYALNAVLIPKVVAICERFLAIPPETAPPPSQAKPFGSLSLKEAQDRLHHTVAAAYWCLGNAQRNLGKPAEAEAAYDKAARAYLRVADRFAPIVRWLFHRESAISWGFVGETRLEQGRAGPAEKAFRKSLELLGDGPQHSRNDERCRLCRAKAQAGLGEALFEQGRRPEARQAFQTALTEALPAAKDAKKPNPFLLTCAARIFLTCPDTSIRDAKRAADLAEQVRALKLGSPEIRAGQEAAKLLAQALYQQGQPEAALKVLKETWAWAYEPETPLQQAKRRLLHALCHWRLKQPEIAWNSYRAALEILEESKAVSREIQALRVEADEFARRFPPPAKK